MYYRKIDGSLIRFASFNGGDFFDCDGTEPLPSQFRTYANDLVAAGELERSDTPFGKGKKKPEPKTPDPPKADLDLQLPADDEPQEGAEDVPYPDVSISVLRRDHLPTIDDLAVLNAWLAAEKVGADRKGAKEAIQERLAELG